MTTAAAIDRLVHHATILEMVGNSVRAETAAKRKDNHPRSNDTTTTTPATTTTPTTTTQESTGEM